MNDSLYLDLPTKENTVIRAQVQLNKLEWWGPLILVAGRWWTIAGAAFLPEQLRDWEILSESVT